MRAVLLAVILIVPVLSGCVLEDVFGGRCNVSPWVAGWVEPGLIGRLPADGTMAGYTIVSDLETGNVTLQDERLDTRWGAANYSFAVLQWQAGAPGSRLGGDQFQFDATGNASTSAVEGTPDETIRKNFIRFLENVTAAAAAQVAAAADQAVASKTKLGRVYADEMERSGADRVSDTADLFVYWVHVDAPLRIEAVFADHVTDAQTSAPAASDKFFADPWTFRFDLLERRVERTFETAHVEMTATLSDSTAFAVHADQQPPQDHMRALLNTTFADLGLGSPSIEKPVFEALFHCD